MDALFCFPISRIESITYVYGHAGQTAKIWAMDSWGPSETHMGGGGGGVGDGEWGQRI